MSPLVRAYGHIPNKPDSRDFPIAALIQKCGVGTATLAETVDNSGFLGRVRDQSITQLCVQFANCKGIEGFLSARGVEAPELSPQAASILTRGLEIQPGDPLVDNGSMPRDFFLSGMAFGVVSESRYPFDPATVNNKLPLDVFEAGADAKIKSFHTVFETGEARVFALKQAIASKLFPSFAMPVDASFENLEDSSIYGGLTGPEKGRHDQLLCGYGLGYFLVRGSWGIGFGFGGNVRISSDFIGSSQCFDFMACDAAPTGIAT